MDGHLGNHPFPLKKGIWTYWGIKGVRILFQLTDLKEKSPLGGG